jgi:peptide/nickel transport system permease protein
VKVLGLIARRVVVAVPVLIGVTVITFAITHSVPGDPARAIAGPYADAQTVANVRAEWKLDDPVTSQYAAYLGRLVQGDLGQSIQSRHPVGDDIATRLPATLELTVVALVLMVVIGLGLGVAAAAFRDRAPDHAARFIVVLGGALPTFWLALVLQLVFFKGLGWLPATGRLDDGAAPPPALTGFYTVDSLITLHLSTFWDAVRHLILPAVSLALLGLAGITRLTRATMLEVLGRDYIRAARARGIPRRTVLLRHALRNALIPSVTMIGLLFGSMIGGAVVIEWVFAWPGIGSYAAASITNLDYTAIMGVTVVIALIYLITNLIVDVVYLALNPVMRDV